MKKLFVSAIVLGSLSLYACGNEGGTAAETEGQVIDRDTVVSEMEVERTVIDTDTTTETETIDTTMRQQP